MLIAHVSLLEPDSPDGVNQTIRGLCHHLPDLGVAVERWHLSTAADRIAHRDLGAIRVVTLPCHRGIWPSLPRPTRDYLAERSRQIDLVHLHSVFLSQNLSIARLYPRYIVTPHGGYGAASLGRRRLLKRLWMTLWEKPYLCRAAAVHAVSPQEQQQLQSIDPQIRAVCIPNGVDASLLQMPVKNPGELPFWLYLGRLAVKQKGLDLLLEAYAQLRRTLGPSVPPLILAGGDYQGGLAHLKQLTHALRLTHAVEFPGPVQGQQKWSLLASTSLFIHTSRWEGMPFALLEALALGRPVLITPQTNLATQVAEHQAGWIVEPSPSAIAAALRVALTCPPAHLNDMSQSARTLATTCLTWPPIARQMLTVYQRTTSHSPMR